MSYPAALALNATGVTGVSDIANAMLIFENSGSDATLQFKVPTAKVARIIYGTPSEKENLVIKFHENASTQLESGISFYTNSANAVGAHALSVNPFQEIVVPNAMYLGTTFSNKFGQHEYVFYGTLPSTANTAATITALPGTLAGADLVRISAVYIDSAGATIPHLTKALSKYFIAYLSYLTGSYNVNVFTGPSASNCLGRPCRIVLTFKN